MESIWSQTCKIEPRESLPGDMKTDLAVIGAGLAGILTAAVLQEAGCGVAVLEAGRIASGQTRNTTAKITCQHGLIYHRLIRSCGKDMARLYADANQTAVAEYRRLIRSRGIDCDFEEEDSFAYGGDIPLLRREERAASALGLPASFVSQPALPFPAAGAVRFQNQARFHPLKFIKALAEPLTVYENTPVRRVEGHVIVTDRGRVQARYIVFACHYPFVNFPGLYFARMHQERSYVLALENAAPARGMWIGTKPGACSLRDWQGLLLLGGDSHRCGENSQGGRYEQLRRLAAERFPGSRVAACWSAQDCVTADRLPYIGTYAPGRPRWYVATGFQKWGMTSSMVAALLLRDLIGGKENPWAALFSPSRFSKKTLTGVVEESGHAIKGLARHYFHLPALCSDQLAPGHGGVVRRNGKKAGVYKDERGTELSVATVCPHLGCQLEWNPDELSWDCPCHGSRFDRRGKLISGPAQKDLPPG